MGKNKNKRGQPPAMRMKTFTLPKNEIWLIILNPWRDGPQDRQRPRSFALCYDWLRLLFGNDLLVFNREKETPIIVQIDGKADYKRHLGAHRWHNFLKDPRPEEQEQVSYIFEYQYVKHGSPANNEWHERVAPPTHSPDFSCAPYIIQPYPRATYSEPPICDARSKNWILPMDRRSPDPPLTSPPTLPSNSSRQDDQIKSEAHGTKTEELDNKTGIRLQVKTEMDSRHPPDSVGFLLRDPKGEPASPQMSIKPDPGRISKTEEDEDALVAEELEREAGRFISQIQAASFQDTSSDHAAGIKQETLNPEEADLINSFVNRQKQAAVPEAMKRESSQTEVMEKNLHPSMQRNDRESTLVGDAPVKSELRENSELPERSDPRSRETPSYDERPARDLGHHRDPNIKTESREGYRSSDSGPKQVSHHEQDRDGSRSSRDQGWSRDRSAAPGYNDRRRSPMDGTQSGVRKRSRSPSYFDRDSYRGSSSRSYDDPVLYRRDRSPYDREDRRRQMSPEGRPYDRRSTTLDADPPIRQESEERGPWDHRDNLVRYAKEAHWRRINGETIDNGPPGKRPKREENVSYPSNRS